MKLNKVLAAVAAAGFLVSPIAAQAGTSASAGKISNLSGVGARQSTAVQKKNNASAGVGVLALLAAGAAVAGVALVVDDDKSNGS
ncbi:hypothetical protein BV97_05744 [Novosphingobium resinovorum]|uniref:Uncharacterized protein n=1 Tax=Novosphingobium resinovorum TaxID=158500 RepID=A0A031IZS0_9SPHN|nr:hypothetical protein [Novosphingobium resinovorum]EZP66688.1 hypothetical protein BV97_05744 [Novosphingobium resinovorum]